jgi:predicted dienelactone hydrolase
MLATWPGHASIDPAKVGAFGFSAGGFTVLVAIGGIPDLSRVAPYCAGHAQTYVCKLLAAHPVPADRQVHDADWIADPRIKAAVIAAPAIGFTFSRSGLKNVRVPVQLWRAATTTSCRPPTTRSQCATHCLARRSIMSWRERIISTFWRPAAIPLAQVAPMICEEHGGFDRAAFHRTFDRDVVRFFSRTLHP